LAKSSGGFGAEGGSWVPNLRTAYELPQKAAPIPIPVREEGGTWKLPGLLAWNRQNLYGLVFWDVVGTNHVLKGFVGGGPLALWSPTTGAFLLSMSPGKSQGRITDMQIPEEPKELTWSCVFGQDDSGKFFYSGKERTEEKTVEEGRQYEFLAKMDRPFARLVWKYEIFPDALSIFVSLQAQSVTREAFVNLPLFTNACAVSLASQQAAIAKGKEGGVRIEWQTPAVGRLEPSVNGKITRLVIPLPADGTPLQLKISKVSL